jgi:SPP1 family predicted phage head-tail adaptor
MIGKLRDRVAFDAPIEVNDGYGGREEGWGEQFKRWAEFIHMRGNETTDAARLQGHEIYKVKIRQSNEAQGILSGWRMRDTRRGVAYNIRSVDNVADQQWIYVMVESGVAI